MLVLTFDGALFKFRVKTPSFTPLFQFPQRIAAKRINPTPYLYFTNSIVIYISIKTYSLLLPKISLFANLLRSYKKACRGKRDRFSVARFNYSLDLHLLNLKQQLIDGTYRPGPYRKFVVNDPKLRQISAPVFLDRILHHAICQIIEPIFEAIFIYDSWACRKGKGIHHAAKRLQQFLRKNGTNYALACDISKYFTSINQQVLFGLIRKKIADPPLLRLLQVIISGYKDPQRSTENNPCGIPIGNLTSQLFANIYLNELDQYIKHVLKRKYYLRYVDDFIILGSSKEDMHEVKLKITEFLRDRLKLELHPKKVRLFPSRLGVDFVGYVVFADHIRLRSKNVRRFEKRRSRLLLALEKGKVTEQFVKASIRSWVAHASHADTYRLRQKLFASSIPPTSCPVPKPSSRHVRTACGIKNPADAPPEATNAEARSVNQPQQADVSSQLNLFDDWPE
ncbi:hypothetical protein A2688_02680 [Candidatus Daviesbacteria bacterium RIFCSPHIGHO2_01_FULL_38_8]|nr:MAG: hypothetical protein A2688_02680 [Candidatus Daviesbacteria bacterium RIFCSPHIGHO2_01_FULL_38_8]